MLPPCEHVDPGIYKVRDAVWVKTPYGRCSTQFKKGTVIGVYSPHSILVNRVPRHIRDIHPQQRSASLEDDDNDESSESETNALLFFSAGPDDSFAEPEETDPKMTMMRCQERGRLNEHNWRKDERIVSTFT